MAVPAVAPFAPLRPGARSNVQRAIDAAGDVGAAELARDESFWMQIATAFDLDRSLLNFNNGGVSPAPRSVIHAVKGHVDYSNHLPPYTMWRVLQPQKEAVRQQLARLMGVDPEEVALTRNASESLQICQFGIDLKAGDEVLCTDQDYPRMINTFRQRAAREGVVLNTFSIPTPCHDLGQVTELYGRHITDKTRMILVSHVINLTGQILPVAEIVALGRERGIPVIVDGAHAFANVNFDFKSLDCDYYATSLHKWLFAPIGTGMLYVRKDRIGDLWPLMASEESQREDIRKFEEIGTYPLANRIAISEAVTFHHQIGAERKEARLLFLRDRWAKRLSAHPEVRLNTSLLPGRACGIANFRIEGVESLALSQHLFRKHRMVVTFIRHKDFEGLRISPSVYSTTDEVDRFCDVVEDVIRNGLPA